MGGGNEESFNFTTSDVTALRDHGFDDLTLVTDDICPSFTSGQWEELFTAYPQVLKDLNSLAVGGFFATRLGDKIRTDMKEDGSRVTTDAFTRQFNLQQKCETPGAIREFEVSVAEELHEQLRNTVSENIRDSVSKIPKDATTEKALEIAIAAYESNKLVGAHDISVLDKILRPKINPPKEYDGFTAYYMIRSMAGLGKLSKPTADDLFHALKWGLPKEVKERFHQKSGVRRVHVVHDLGLDPQSDDYNAVKLLMQLNETGP